MYDDRSDCVKSLGASYMLCYITLVILHWVVSPEGVRVMRPALVDQLHHA